jgi:hypothetical protein
VALSECLPAMARPPTGAAFSLFFREGFQKLSQCFLAQNLGDGFRSKTITVNPDPERARPPQDFPDPCGRVSIAPGDHVVVA